MEIILITGVPGFGKTTIGNYLKEKYNFLHLDIEEYLNWDVGLAKIKDLFLSNNLVEFVQEVRQINNKVVMTWGFMPGGSDDTILELIQLGVKMIWFDGNREAARKVFITRENGSAQAIEALNAQMEKINGMDLSRFQSTTIDTFDTLGEFKSKEEIVSLIRRAHE